MIDQFLAAPRVGGFYIAADAARLSSTRDPLIVILDAWRSSDLSIHGFFSSMASKPYSIDGHISRFAYVELLATSANELLSRGPGLCIGCIKELRYPGCKGLSVRLYCESPQSCCTGLSLAEGLVSLP